MTRAVPRTYASARWTLGAGVFWAIFSAWLAVRGEVPSGPVPWPREWHYAAQAVFVVPWMVVLFSIHVGLSRLIAGRLGGSVEQRLPLERMDRAYGGPLLLCFLVPEAIAYALGGLEALGLVTRFAAPVLVLAVVLATARVISRDTSLSTPRALLASLGGTLGQALVGSLALR